MTEKLTVWASENGIKTDSTYIHSSSDATGQSLRASKFIARGECIVHCPHNMMINNQFIIANTIIGQYVKKHPLEFDPLQLISAFILYEWKQGEKSEFTPFVESMPKKYSLPVVWSETLTALLPPEMTKKLNEFRDYMNETCVIVKKMFASWDMEVNCDEVKWAFCCVNTRCFYVAEHLNPLLNCTKVKNNMVIIPYLDMCNHSYSNLTDYDVSIDGCDIVAMEDFCPGDEINLCYGTHSNYTLLIEYGFVMPHNPHNCVIYTANDILQCLPIYMGDLKRSETFEKFAEKELFFISEGEGSWGLQVLSAALKTNEFDFFFEQFFNGHLDFDSQKDLLRKLYDFKFAQYQSLLKELQNCRVSDQDHFELLNDFLRLQLEIIKEVVFPKKVN